MKHPGFNCTQKELVAWGDATLERLTKSGPDRLVLNARGDTIPMSDTKFLGAKLEITCVVIGSDDVAIGCEAHNEDVAKSKVEETSEIAAIATRQSKDKLPDGNEIWKWGLALYCD